MEDHNIPYFRNLWEMNVTDLENQCKMWEQICTENQIPDEVCGEIRTTIGLARLLMNQKLKQFKGLIDDSEFSTGEKEITCSDLQGFWDMVFSEVEKIIKCFNRLDKCKNNEWKFVEENSEKLLKKKVTKNPSVASKKIESTKSRALAAKQRLAEVKQKMLAQREQKKENFVEIIPSKQELNPIKDSTSNKVVVKRSNKKMKNVDVEEKDQDSLANELTEEFLLKNDIKQKGHPASAQNKENVLPSESKNVSVPQAKSKTKTETPVPEKTKRKVKEVVKLQCITRSQKRAMLAQQIAVQKS